MVETEELRRSQPCLGYAEAQPALAAKQQQGYAPALSPLAASHLTRSDTSTGCSGTSMGRSGFLVGVPGTVVQALQWGTWEVEVGTLEGFNH